VTKVEALIRPDRVESVVERLRLIGARGLTVSTVQGCGRSAGRDSTFRGVTYRIHFRPKVLLEWVGDDDDVDAVIRAVLKAAVTGRIGDGKIFVSPVVEAVRVRTGERGKDAL
jgi:nitrogen regulatory protein P-II 1